MAYCIRESTVGGTDVMHTKCTQFPKDLAQTQQSVRAAEPQTLMGESVAAASNLSAGEVQGTVRTKGLVAVCRR